MDIRVQAGPYAAVLNPLARKPARGPDAEAEAGLGERQREARSVLSSFAQMTQSMKNDRKARAKQKLEQLKRELETLRQFAVLGDPKAVARQAARIARDLASAAKEYGSAKGSPVMAAAVADEPVADEPADGEGAGQDQVDGAAEVKAQAEGAEAQAAEHDDKLQPKTPEEGAQARRDTLMEGVAKRDRQAGVNEADAKFANEARKLARQLKALMEQERQKAAGDRDVDHFAHEVDGAGNAIEWALNGAGTGLDALVPAFGMDIKV